MAEVQNYQAPETQEQKSHFSKFFGRMERVNKRLIELNETTETRLRMVMLEEPPVAESDVKSPREALPMLWDELHHRLSHMEDLVAELERKIDRVRM